LAKVHVWLPNDTHVGHTALTVGDDYISFWPDGGAEKKDLKIKRSQPGMWMQDLQEDITNEGMRWPITIDLPRLDTARVLKYIKDLQREAPRYQLARNNCSHVVANALMAGSPCTPSFTPHAGH
jgi:hypothetical protein